MRATPLDAPVAEQRLLVAVLQFGVPALGVLQAVDGLALEPGVDVLVVRPSPMGDEAHAEEQAVRPVHLSVGQQSLDQRPCHPEAVPALLALVPQAHHALGEVDHHRQVLGPWAPSRSGGVGQHQHLDGIADGRTEGVGQLQQRLHPGLQLAEHVEVGDRPRRLLGGDPSPLPLGIRRQVRLLVGEDGSHLVVAERVRHRAPASSARRQLGRAPGDQQPAVIVTASRHEVEEDGLVGEDVRLVTVHVVQVPQLVVEEAGRSRGGKHKRRAHLLDVPQRPLHPVRPLLSCDLGLRRLREVVDHRVPNGPRILQEVAVVTPALGEGQQCGEVEGPGVVLVQDGGGAVVDGQGRVPERTVGGGDQRGDHDPQTVQLDGRLVGHRHEPPETERPQRRLQIVHRELRQEHGGPLVHVPAQVLGVEVVVVEVGDVQVVAPAQAVPVEARVVGEREPGRRSRRGSARGRTGWCRRRSRRTAPRGRRT